MSSDTLIAVMLLGSAAVACFIAIGAFTMEAFIRRIPLSSAGPTGDISVEDGLKLNKEKPSANSSIFRKIDVCACLILFFCVFFFMIPLAMNLDGLPGKVSNLIFLGLSGNAKLPFGGSLFFTIGLGLLFFLFVGGFAFSPVSQEESGNGINLGERLFRTALWLMLLWILTLILLLDTRPRWFIKNHFTIKPSVCSYI